MTEIERLEHAVRTACEAHDRQKLRVKELEARVEELKERSRLRGDALQHCVDLGPPCPLCGAEDEETENDGLYPHASGCPALTLLPSEAKS